MQSEHIVPEAENGPGLYSAPKIIAGLSVFVAAFIAAGYYGDEKPEGQSDTTRQNAELAVLKTSFSTPDTQDKRSFLNDLTPISRAEAKSVNPDAPQPLHDLEVPEETSLSELAASSELEETPSATPEPQYQSKSVTVKNGDSLSTLFDRNELKTADWLSLANLDGEAKRLLKLRPGDTLQLQLAEDRSVMELEVALDEIRRLKIQRNADQEFVQSVIEDQVDIREARAEGVIENSLFLTAKAAGLSDNITMELTEIFAWDVDFALDIRSGDAFRLVYEEIYRDGEKLKDGKILAAEFVNRGKAIRAVRYVDEEGRGAYYSPDGAPMKKAFLRSPVDFKRISSTFSRGRKHPVLNTIRAHKGVDYAASRGTPIRSAGAGKVIFAGRKGGYGNVVIVQHAGKYKTLYAHMNNFRRGIRRGVSVNQGQTIGYVGSTGLATGPHLHYEFLINDRHVNPLTVRLPSAPQIAKSKLPRFKDQTAVLLAKLEQTGTEVASAASAQ